MIEKIHTLLLKYPIAERLGEAELKELSNVITLETYKEGDVLIEQGTSTNDLLFLEDGIVDVVMRDDQKEFVINQVTGPDIIGEMAFITNRKRSNSVVAKSDVTMLKLSRDDLNTNNSELFTYKFMALLSQITAERLESRDQKVRDELLLRTRFGKIVILLIVILGLVSLIVAFNKTWQQYIPYALISVIGYVIAGVIISQVIKATEHPLSHFGVNLKNWKRSLFEGIAIGLLLLVTFNVFWQKQLWGQLGIVASLDGARYLFSCIMQEFMVRGVLQTCMQEFYQDSKGYLSIFIASFITIMYHIHLGMLTTAMSFVMSVFLGFIYLRHKNLIGVTIIHYCIGIIAYFLGFFAQA